MLIVVNKVTCRRCPALGDWEELPWEQRITAWLVNVRNLSSTAVLNLRLRQSSSNQWNKLTVATHHAGPSDPWALLVTVL